MSCRGRVVMIVFAVVLTLLTGSAGLAVADDCASGGQNGDDFISVHVGCQFPGNVNGSTIANPTLSEPAYLRYKWHTPCMSFSANHVLGDSVDCVIARACADQAERSWQLWGLSAETREWEYLLSQCFGRPPTAADTPQPQVTPGLVLNAIRRIGLPAVTAHTQPAGKTLVNFETIFYAQPETFTRTLTLLGQRVDVEATPSQYVWHHGDGTSAATTSPGAPYPAKDIVYEYTDAHITVQASVDVTYMARFRVSGGAWQAIPDTVTIAGPPTDLRISEATAVLSGDYG
jgi:hypothetical protein